MLGILIALLVLAGSALWQAGRAMRSATQASNAAAEEQQALGRSYLAQAQAGRLSGVMGRKATGLKAIAAAAAIKPSIELRNEAIAHLALLDFEPTEISWTNTPGLARATIDPKLSRLLEGDAEGTIQLRSLNQSAPTTQLRNTNGFVYLAEFDSDAHQLAVVYSNTALTVWDLDSRAQKFTRPAVAWVGFDPRGERLAAAGYDRWLRLLNPTSGTEIARIELTAPARLGAFDSSGLRLALQVDDNLEIWEWRTGKRLETFPMDHQVFALAWRHNLLAVGDEAGEVHLYNLVTGRARRLSGHQELVSQVVFNPRGDVLLSSSYDGTTRAWDALTGQLLFSTAEGFARQFTADGERVLFGTESGWRLWRVSEPVGYRRLDCASGPLPNVWHVDFSRDGERLAATKENGVWIFPVSGNQPPHFQPGELLRAAYFLPHHTNLLITTARRMDIWTLSPQAFDHGQSLMLTNPRPIPVTNAPHLEPGAPSADRGRFALPVSAREIALFDLERKAETARLTNALLPGTLSFSANGQWLAAGTFHGSGTRVWNLATLQLVKDFNEGNTRVAFSPDGRWLASGGSRLLQVFSTDTWERAFARPSETGSDLPNSVAFAPDATLLATVQQRRRVELHHVAGWDLAAALVPPDPQVVTWLAFSPDSRQLAVSTAQDLVQLWDLHRLHEELANLGLDLRISGGLGQLPAGRSTIDARQLADVTWLGGSLLPVGLAVLFVIVSAWFIRQRQQRLLRAYLEVDRLAEQQRQQLGQAQAEMLHAQKMRALGTLAAGIAHDFNNLLSVVRLSNRLIAREAGTQPAIQENSDEIEQAVQRGKAVVRSMLGYTREAPDSTAPFSVPELVEDTVALLTRQFLSGITLKIELDKNAPPVTGSRNRLEQVLLNLLVNASEAMNGQGELAVGLRMAASPAAAPQLAPRSATRYLELYVRDSGPGIAPEVLPRIFEPFFTTKHVGATHGTGLGLHLVYSIAQTDGLGIGVDTATGAGTTFRILIPVSPPAPIPSPP